MIIDVHTQVWSHPDQLGPEIAERFRRIQANRWGQFDAGAAAHEQAMSCVDGSIVHGFRADRLGAYVPNEVIAEFVTRDPQRRVGVAGIDPMGEDPLGQIDQAINLGLIGITVAPAAQGFHPQHSTAMRVYERCRELRLPIFITPCGPAPLVRSAIMDFARPSHWDEVARTFPDLPIVITHLGSPWIDETLTLLNKHDHLFADLAGLTSRPWKLYNALLEAVHLGVMDQLLFGSGFPTETPAKAIEALYSFNAFSQGTQLLSVPRAQVRSIVERDALPALGIDAHFTARESTVDRHAHGEQDRRAPGSLGGSAS